MPSARKEVPKKELEAKKKLDSLNKKIFVNSKIRDSICCDECGRPRLVYSMRAPCKKDYAAFALYKETVDYSCGAPLFAPEDELDEELKPLAALFHVKQARRCSDEVEDDYFNYANVAGCADLEWVCSRCGADSEESSLDPSTCGQGDVTGYSGFAMIKGQMVLPLCMGCRNKKLKPKLIGTVNQVEKEKAKRAAAAKARQAKEAKSKAQAAATKARAEAAKAAAAAEAEDMSEDDEGADASGAGVAIDVHRASARARAAC